MKKYLALAIFLGAVAFLSVSYLAQAEPEAAPAAPAAVAPPVPMPADAAPAVDAKAKDQAECETLASAATTEGAPLSDEAKAESVKKCMADKGHAEAPAAPAAPEAAPAAPAAH